MTPSDLKKLRKRMGLSQEAFGIRTGTSQSLITRYELGKREIPSDHAELFTKHYEQFLEEESLPQAEPPPAPVALPSRVELGPMTIRVLADLILAGIREMRGEYAIRPEVIQSAKEGDRYRARCQEILTRGE